MENKRDKSTDYGSIPSTIENANNEDTTAIAKFLQQRFCGVCCDMRCAVIIVNIIDLFVNLLAMSSLIILSTTQDEDSVYTSNQGFDYSLGLTSLFTVVKVAVNLLTIQGALTFNMLNVGVGLFLYIMEAIVAAMSLDITIVLYCVFFCYPHAFLLHQIHSRWMTEESYNEVQHCCCCLEGISVKRDNAPLHVTV